jgi:TolB protein
MNGKFLKFSPTTFLALSFLLILSTSVFAQDWVRTGTNLGVQRIRIAVADFKASSGDAQTAPLKTVFDSVLFNDLKNSGVFDMVAKSMAPGQTPGGPQEINLGAWSAAPANAQMVAFGSFGVGGGRITVQGFVFDTRNAQTPQILGKQYSDTAVEESARQIAHRFADEIIMQLGGGINGICETHIYYGRQ